MWTTTKTTKYGVAVYNWRGDTRYGLPLEIGETVQILEECAGWYRGFSTKNRAVKGIFPSSYVHLKPCKIDNEGLFESVIPLEDPVVREVTLVLREWGGIWKRLYVEREEYKFNALRKVMRELLEWRRQLLAGTLTTDQTRELKLRIINKVDWGNRNSPSNKRAARTIIPSPCIRASNALQGAPTSINVRCVIHSTGRTVMNFPRILQRE